MKQKIVIKVLVRGDKCRSKAMQIAADANGVLSVELQGENKDRVVVIGDGVDAAVLAIRLRKKLGLARLETIEEVKEKKEDVVEYESDDTETSSDQTTAYQAEPTFSQQECPSEYDIVFSDPYPNTCTIM